MWPLAGEQVARICELALSTEQTETHARRPFSAVLTGEERDPRREDIVFAVTDDRAILTTVAANAGALVIAPLEHEAIARLGPEALLNVVFVPSPLRCFRALAKYMRAQLRCPVVAVGGSNGKTTTKEMIAAVLSGRGSSLITRTPGTNNGWMGIPITLCHPLHRSAHPPDAVVVEIGIDALGVMEHHLALVRPDTVVISVLGPEHIEGLGTTPQAVEEELRLFALPNARRVWMLEDEELRARAGSMARADDVIVVEEGSDAPTLPGVRVTFRILEDELRADVGGRMRLRVTLAGQGPTDIEVPLAGRHNARNAALACGVGALHGLSPEEIRSGFARFRPLEQRCAISSLPGDCLLVDDTYNASPKSMSAALDVLTTLRLREHVAVLGDMLELGSESEAHHDDLASRLIASGVEHVFLVGSAMRRVHDALRGRPELFTSLEWNATDVLPEKLLRWPHWDGCAVLVKGSRGMRMERFARLVETRQHARGASATAGVLVVGVDREHVGHRLRFLLGRREQPAVHVLDATAVLRGDHRRLHPDTVVLAGFSPSSEAQVEEELALLAQPLLLLGPSARVFALGIREEAATALREVIPPGVAWATIQCADEIMSSIAL